MEKPAIVEVLPDKTVTGAGMSVLYLMEELRNDYDFTLLLPKGSALKDRIDGVRIREIPTGKDRDFSLLSLPRFARVLRELKPDILHTHGAFPARLAGRLCGIPNLLSTRHRIGNLPSSPFFTEMTRTLYNFTTDFTVVPEKLARLSLLFEGNAAAEKVVTIPCGTPSVPPLTDGEKRRQRQARGIPESAFVIGSVGRNDEWHGQDVLLFAFSHLKIKDAFLVLVGDGDRLESCRSLAVRLGIASHVRFVPETKIPCEWIKTFDVSVFPRRTAGGCRTALFECMAQGLPIVASNLGEIKEALTDGRSALLTPPAKAKPLANAIEKLHSRPELAAALGNNARKVHTTRFSQTVMAAGYRRLFDYLLSTERATRTPTELRCLFGTPEIPRNP